MGATAGLSSSAAVLADSRGSLLDTPAVAPDIYRWTDYYGIDRGIGNRSF
jgi:hypothetical protein